MWSHGERRRGAVKKSSEDCCGCCPDLYDVAGAAKFLDCSERQVRQEIRENKITYRRPRPIGGPSASKSSKRWKKLSDDLPNVQLDVALKVLEEALRDKNLQSDKVATILKSCRNGELCASFTRLDPKVATAIIAVIAACALGGGDADPLLRTFFEGLP